MCGDRACASDGGEVAFVAVAEASSGVAVEAVADDPSGVTPLLHRDGREPGKCDRRAVGSADANHVSDREHVGVTGE